MWNCGGDPLAAGELIKAAVVFNYSFVSPENFRVGFSPGPIPTVIGVGFGITLRPILVGFYAGPHFRHRVSQEIFCRIVRGMLFLITASLAVWPAWNLNWGRRAEF